MQPRSITWILTITALLTALWATLFIYTTAASPAIQTLTDQISAIESQGAWFIFNYLNASLLTLAITASLASLYTYCRDSDLLWANIALVFVPIYAACNLVAYLSQVFVVPGLIQMAHEPQTAATAEILLRLTVHTWPGSFVEFLNGLAYAVLGIPSIILSILLARISKTMQTGSWVFALSGLFSIIALFGIGLSIPLLKYFSPLGGFLALTGLILFARQFYRQAQNALPHPGIVH